MSIEKQKLYNEIDTLPEELAYQVIDFIGYLKLLYIDTEVPDIVTIKSKKDLKEKLEKGIDSLNNGDIVSEEEVYDGLDKI